MREVHHPDPAHFSLPTALHALSDPIRLRIMKRLARADGFMSCGEAAGDGLPKATQSFHFRVLREAGLVITKRDGKRYLSRLRSEFETRFPGLLSAVLERADDV